MTIDQVILLVADKKLLVSQKENKPVERADKEMGIPAGSSFVEQWRIQNAIEEAAAEKHNKKKRRRELHKIIAEAKERGEL